MPPRVVVTIDATEPLLPGSSKRVVDVSTLKWWWPCLLTGALFWCAAMAVSVGVTSWVLDDPTRAAYYQTVRQPPTRAARRRASN
jgi:hypothetical protein